MKLKYEYNNLLCYYTLSTLDLFKFKITHLIIYVRKQVVITNLTPTLLCFGFISSQQMIEKYENKLVPVTHPVYKIVADVTKTLIKGNQDLPQVKGKGCQ